MRATEDDTTLFLSRGSGVSIIRFRSRDSLTLDLLSDINSSSLTGRVMVRESLLCVGSGGIEFHDISDLASPELLGSLSLAIYDYFVTDTLCYTINRESLAVYSVADPANPHLVGACRESGYTLFVADSHAYVGDRNGLYIIDVSNPASPHRVGRLGGDVITVAVRDTLCFYGTTEPALRVCNVRNPTAPTPVGSLSGIEVSDICLPPTCDTVLYTPKLHVINIASPASPRIVGQVSCPGWDYGVDAVPALNYALVADYFDGLAAVNLTSPASPMVDSLTFSAGSSEDIDVDGNRAYVAQYFCGMRILDVTDPTRPDLLGIADTAGALPPSRAIVARDSFAYLGWTTVPYFRAFDVTDPSRPVKHGGCDITNPPEDMVIDDSLVYVAEIARFQVVNVARPREPELVGSCVAGDATSAGLWMQDTLAYVANDRTQFINVAVPTNPAVIGELGRGAWDIVGRDTIAVATVGPLAWYDVGNPAAPRLIDSISLGHTARGLALVDSIAYVGVIDGRLCVVSLSDLHQPRVLGDVTLPYAAKRITYAEPYLYVCCWDAGVCIYDTFQTAIAEEGPPHGPRGFARAGGSMVRDALVIEVTCSRASSAAIDLYDVVGTKVVAGRWRLAGARERITVDVSGLPCGVYVARVVVDGDVCSLRVVKLEGR